jgi:hypothetical protein
VYVGHVCREVSSGKNIGDKYRLVIRNLHGRLHRPDMGEWNVGVLGLRALNGPLSFGPPKKVVRYLDPDLACA